MEVDPLSRCDLHVHSCYSTDSGNYALRRARLAESYTEPERVYRVCRQRGMRFVTLSDHNTLDGALRIAHLPDTFLSVEVTTCFPEDDVPLHVLVWDLSEEDHRDLQPFRPSVYELVAFLDERGLAHALAHPLYRMGRALDASHVERLLLLFGVWEGRNGARPQESNELACLLAAAASPSYVRKLAERHGLEPRHDGTIALTGGSDDHGALDIATTFTEAPGESVSAFLGATVAGHGTPRGQHGSSVKLAHAVASLGANAYRDGGGDVSSPFAAEALALLDADFGDPAERHRELVELGRRATRLLGGRARGVSLEPSGIVNAGSQLAALAFAAALQAPYLATAHHHAGTRAGLVEIETAFFGAAGNSRREPRVIVFSDTFDETNGVAGTMRRLASEAAAGSLSLRVAVARTLGAETAGIVAFAPDWTLPLPGYELLELRFPILAEVLERIEKERPDAIHVATPGPLGLCGLICAKLLGVPVVGSYHSELGPFALHITRDVLVAQTLDMWVDWFYRQCALVLAPTRTVAEALEARGLDGRVAVWGRGVDTERFTPERRSEAVRAGLLGDGRVLLLSVGRLSEEKRLQVLLDAFGRLVKLRPDARLAIVGEGPARAALERDAPQGVRFLGELRGDALADTYAAANVFCFPSTTETFGQVILEAAASGLPVVAARAGGASELVRHEWTGTLVPPDDSAAFADALGRLLANRGRVRAYSAAARALALGYTWERSDEQLRAAYRSVTGGTRPHRRLALV
jgi:glycosyltransferase involved in cell wall biosynthesis